MRPKPNRTVTPPLKWRIGTFNQGLMTYDKIVLDIETKNSFFDVGQENTAALQASFIGVYSYNQNTYLSFFENELERLGELFKQTELIVGFCLRRFDMPVLKKYFNFDIMAIPTLDLFDDITKTLGFRVGLNVLAEANIGLKKTGRGLEAIKLYKEGRLEELKNYCLNDVKLTKELYELAQGQGYLWVPRRDSPLMIKVALNYSESRTTADEPVQTRLF